MHRTEHNKPKKKKNVEKQNSEIKIISVFVSPLEYIIETDWKGHGVHNDV